MPSFLFKTKQVKIATLGEYLTSVRNKLNLDIKTVALLTQIKESYIENLEAGRSKDLPAEVYVKGFLKSLAAVYRIKEAVLVEQYDKEFGFEPRFKQASKKSAISSIRLTPKTIILSVTVLVALITLFYIGSQLRSVLAAPQLIVEEPAADLSLNSNSLVVKGLAEIGAEVAINSQSVLLDKNGVFNENLILSPGLNIIEVVAKNKFGKISKQTRRVNAEVQSLPKAQTAPIAITVEVGPDSAWIYLEVDGVVAQRGTMLAGSSKTVSGKQDVLLTSANAGSTTVIFNGKDLGKLGRPGEVIRNVEFTAAN